MGYPMTWKRVKGRNKGLSPFVQEDLKRFEEDSMDTATIHWLASNTGYGEEDVYEILSLLFAENPQVEFHQRTWYREAENFEHIYERDDGSAAIVKPYERTT